MRTYLSAIFLLFLYSVSPAYAADGDKPSSGYPISLKATGLVLSDADFSTSGGAAQLSTGQLSLKVKGFSAGYEVRKYSWSDVGQLNFGNGDDDPWNTLHRITIGYDHFGRINESWNYLAAITGTSSFEKEMSGSYGAAVRGGFMYTIDENWKTLFGLRVFTNSLRTSAMPFLGLTYENIDEEGAGPFLSLGAPSAEAGYAFSKQAKARFNFSLDGRTYRLKDNSTVSPKGYMQTSGMQTGLYFDWSPTQAFNLSVGPEYTFSREIKLFDKDGDNVGSKVKQDSAVGGSLQFGYKF